eukprot:jgi/Mesvir1/156/Mv13517-RA.1
MFLVIVFAACELRNNPWDIDDEENPLPTSLLEIQLRLERRGTDDATQRFIKQSNELFGRDPVVASFGPSLPWRRVMVLEWFRKLTDAIRDVQDAYSCQPCLSGPPAKPPKVAGTNADDTPDASNKKPKGRRPHAPSPSPSGTSAKVPPALLEGVGGTDGCGPYLMLVEPEKLAVIALHTMIAELMRQPHVGAVRAVRLSLAIAKAVQTDVNTSLRFQEAHDQGLHWSKAYIDWFASQDSEGARRLRAELRQSHHVIGNVRKGYGKQGGPHVITPYMVQQMSRAFFAEPEWPPTVLAKLGGMLVYLAIKNCTVDIARLESYTTPGEESRMLGPCVAWGSGESPGGGCSGDAGREGDGGGAIQGPTVPLAAYVQGEHALTNEEHRFYHYHGAKRREKRVKPGAAAAVIEGEEELLTDGADAAHATDPLEKGILLEHAKDELLTDAKVELLADGTGLTDEVASLTASAAPLDTSRWQGKAPPPKVIPGDPMRPPAFAHAFFLEPGQRKGMGRRYGYILAHLRIMNTIGDISTDKFFIPPRYPPMVIPPKPWTSYNKGGYLLLPSTAMRTRGNKTQLGAIRDASTTNQMKRVFEALNALGEVPWRIRRPVLDVATAIWKHGGGKLDVPSRSYFPFPTPINLSTATKDEADEYKKAVRKVRRLNLDLKGLQCEFIYKLDVANDMKHFDRFYYPHTLDFRGRAYPAHPHLNHLGSDACRGILEFADGCELGPSGLRWLKIQLANVYANGIDKAILSEREKFVDTNLDKVLASADDPLGKGTWWMGAEDPFQCLAACQEVAAALRSPDPTKFMSHLPVHQDGSCNGLQHYAALGRDMDGGASVNLVPASAPSDVYTRIAERVKIQVQQDMDKGVPVAAELMKHVDRKLVKQTVMTSVYGVTMIGARLQILARLKERDIDDELAYQMSVYAAKVTLKGLLDMFESATAIMTWLSECAKKIAYRGKPVMWHTPLGLPVVQPYHRITGYQVKTMLQSLTIADPSSNDTKVNVVRQKSGFAPNFVHSLDSTHMMMTAMACAKAGVTFAGVHDSFWTHAGRVGDMNRLLREQFVELHSKPILDMVSPFLVSPFIKVVVTLLIGEWFAALRSKPILDMNDEDSSLATPVIID